MRSSPNRCGPFRRGSLSPSSGHSLWVWGSWRGRAGPHWLDLWVQAAAAAASEGPGSDARLVPEGGPNAMMTRGWLGNGWGHGRHYHALRIEPKERPSRSSLVSDEEADGRKPACPRWRTDGGCGSLSWPSSHGRARENPAVPR